MLVPAPTASLSWTALPVALPWLQITEQQGSHLPCLPGRWHFSLVCNHYSGDKRRNMGGWIKEVLWLGNSSAEGGERFVLLCSSILRWASQASPAASQGSTGARANRWSPGECIDLDLFKYTVVHVSRIIKNVHVRDSPPMPAPFELHSWHYSTDLMSCS